MAFYVRLLGLVLLGTAVLPVPLKASETSPGPNEPEERADAAVGVSEGEAAGAAVGEGYSAHGTPAPAATFRGSIAPAPSAPATGTTEAGQISRLPAGPWGGYGVSVTGGRQLTLSRGEGYVITDYGDRRVISPEPKYPLFDSNEDAADSNEGAKMEIDLDADNLPVVNELLCFLIVFNLHWDPLILPGASTLGDEDLMPLEFESADARRQAFERHEEALAKLGRLGFYVEEKSNPDRTALAVNVSSAFQREEPVELADLPLDDVLNLRQLSLTDVEVNDADAARLGKRHSLRHLFLISRHLTDAGLAELRNLEDLEYLVLIADKVSPEAVLELVENLPKLKHFGLHASLIGMGSGHVKQLRARHPALLLKLR